MIALHVYTLPYFMSIRYHYALSTSILCRLEALARFSVIQRSELGQSAKTTSNLHTHLDIMAP